MSFRVMHYLGSREDLLAQARRSAEEMRHLDDSEDFDEDEWDQAVDDLAAGRITDTAAAKFLLIEMIGNTYPPVSMDFGLHSYHALSRAVGGRLAEYMVMFMEGRDFGTGVSGFGEDATCGYLDPAEVTELRDLLRAAGPQSEAAGLEGFVTSLSGTFDQLAEGGRGSLFVMT
ncbi:hypothetical protein FDO65_04820 [Nakamurella flava]|uniref:DUF1877 family protein n=1 Tax=Nakamurella flava TaxID=2576308 RepID=A0A4U6QKF1_9ACTN|nr:hypothetical protein [Nakamurella flava]TKV60980.1 hypothetical protein FDO65_04820 [Nakamurella flava]